MPVLQEVESGEEAELSAGLRRHSRTSGCPAGVRAARASGSRLSFLLVQIWAVLLSAYVFIAKLVFM